MNEDRQNILLVEDDIGHAELIHRAFEFYRERFQLTIVSTLKEAREHLEKYPPHLVITDLILPDGRGVELLPAEGEDPEFAYVVMTGFGDEQIAVDTLKAGAMDYVVKLETNLRDMPRIADRALRQWENIIERKRAEEALAESEEKFRALTEKTNDLISILNEEGIYQYISPAVMQIIGLGPEDVSGHPPSDFLHSDDKTPFYNIIEQAKQKAGSTVPLPNFRLRHNNGHWVTMEGVVTNLLSVKGVRGFVVNCRDVTRLKEMEDGLRRMQKLESIGILAGGIAHDYNNLLTIILGNLTVARISDSHEQMVSSLVEAEKGVQKARDLTQQLLTFAKGGAPIKETSSIEEIIRDSAGFSLRGSNVSLELGFQENLYPVDVDRGQISQVVQNLVLNADQAMPDGGVISIQVNNTLLEEENIYGLAPGGYICIELRDQGTGIPKDYKEKIFDPYFTTKSNGSGLGLSIVYSIIKRHNGFVDLRSKVDEGTVFFLYLPASRDKAVKSKTISKPFRGEGKVMVMDDEENIREVVGHLVQSLGYTVTVTSSGEEAVEKCKTESFDAIIMDLTVPGGMGGEEAASIIRGFDKKVKIIVSSGYSNDPVMAKYKEYGFSGVLQKPYKLEQVSEALHRVLTPGASRKDG